MNIDRVRYFHIFAETGSLVKASEVLHISQPALSKALKQLEQELGSQLVESDGRGLKLTRYGMDFRKETQGLLNQWLSLPERLKSGQNWEPTRIGSFEVFTTYFLNTITEFVDLDSLELHEYGPGKLEQAVANQLIDIGITYSPIPKSGVDFVEVTKIQMGIFGLSKFKSTKLENLPFVVPLMPAEGTPSKMVGLDGWPDHKIQRNVKYRVSMMESAMQLCRQGLAVAYLPKFVVDIHNQFALSEFKLTEHQNPVAIKDRKQSVFIVKRTNAEESRLYRQLAKSLRSLE